METPLIALARGRYIIRHYSPVTTIGGGEILHTHPQKHKRSAATVERMAILERGTATPFSACMRRRRCRSACRERRDRHARRCARPFRRGCAAASCAGRVIRVGQEDEVIHAEHYRQMGERIGELLAEFHAQFPLKTGASPKKNCAKSFRQDCRRNCSTPA